MKLTNMSIANSIQVSF